MSGHRIPLKISLILHDTSLEAVLRVLIPHSARWSSSAVDAVFYSHVRELFDIVEVGQCSFGRLCAMDLTIREETDQAIDLRSIFTLKNSSDLQVIRLHSEAWPFARLPSHITSLTLGVSSDTVPFTTHLNILRILRTLPQLVTFSLSFPDASFTNADLESPEDEILVMSQLENLSLTGCNPIFGILEHLTLPSLRSLALRETGKDSMGNLPHIGSWFYDMLRRSSPPVLTLELHCIDAAEVGFIDCSMLLPSLESSYFTIRTSLMIFSLLCPLRSQGKT